MLKRDEYKFLYYRERLKKLMDGILISPVTVEWGLTTYCNHSCSFCAFSWHRVNKVSLDCGVVLKSLSDMAEMGVRGMMLCGDGEPLLYKDFKLVTDFILESKMEIGLATNGSILFSKKNRDINYKDFTYIRISLDAGNREEHQKTHGSDDFDKVIENIRELVNLKNSNNSNVTIGVHYTLSEQNIESLLDGLLLCKEAGVDYFHIGPIVKSTKYTNDIPNPYILNEDQMILLERHGTDKFKVFISRNRFEDVSGTDVTTRGFNLCRAQNYFTIITADGGVYPCCHLQGVDNYSFGNINEQSFKNIWFSDKHKYIMKHIDFKDCSESCNKREINRLLHRLFNTDMHSAFLG